MSTPTEPIFVESTPTNICRCAWVSNDPLDIAYHDEEWGVAVHDDIRLFEFLTLEGAQAGLSWKMILRKRENYRVAFDGFDPAQVATYDDRKLTELLNNPGIVRNRLKVNAAVQNARAFLSVQAEFGSFDRYIWSFVNSQIIFNSWQTYTEVPTETLESRAMSKDLLKRGFKFVGSTICYAFMQACGLVHDHTVDCFRYQRRMG